VRLRAQHVRLAAVVKRRPALDLERYGAAQHAHPPHHQMLAAPGPAVADGHEIHQLGQAISGEKAREQNIRVGPVELAGLERHSRRDAKPAAALLVEERRKDAGGIKARQAQPVQCAVGAHQRGRVQVADDAVLLDRRHAHVCSIRQSRRVFC